MEENKNIVTLSNESELSKEFKQDTITRLLADQVRFYGIGARIADDVFFEHVDLGRKQEYIKERIAVATNVLGSLPVMTKEISQGSREETIFYQEQEESILHGSSRLHEQKGIVADFYHASKRKSANDEMYEALQEFAVVVKGSTKNQQVAKVQIARLIFNLLTESNEKISFMAEQFVQSGLCESLMNQLKLLSVSGEKKWKSHGPLIMGYGRNYPYCAVKLNSEDYQVNVVEVQNTIKTFVENNLLKLTGKRSKIIFAKFFGRFLKPHDKQVDTVEQNCN